MSSTPFSSPALPVGSNAPFSLSSVFVPASETFTPISTRCALLIAPTKSILPIHSEAEIRFGHIGPQLNPSTWYAQVRLPSGITLVTRNIPAYFEEPSLEELEENCTSVLGDSVEPDGFDSDGSPSWFIVYGVI